MPKPKGLPFLGPEETAIVVGFSLDVIIRQRFCEWCVFWDVNQALELASQPLPPKARLVLFSALISEASQRRILRRLRKQNFKSEAEQVSSGLFSIQTRLESLFGQRIKEGKRGPLPRPRFVRPDPMPELELPPKPEPPPPPETEKVVEDDDFPVRLRKTKKGFELITDLTRDELVEKLGLFPFVSDIELRKAIVLKLRSLGKSKRKKPTKPR